MPRAVLFDVDGTLVNTVPSLRKVWAASEDADARDGPCAAFDGASRLLMELPAGSWAVVTGNYEHRVRLRFARAGLPIQAVVVDAGAVRRGKPDPEGYLLAARALNRRPSDCLVLEDGEAGARAGIAAGMTVWTVHSQARTPGVARTYDTFAQAAGDVRAWVEG